MVELAEVVLSWAMEAESTRNSGNSGLRISHVAKEATAMIEMITITTRNRRQRSRDQKLARRNGDRLVGATCG